MDENATELDAADNDSGKYEVKAIWDSAVYARDQNRATYQASTTWCLRKDTQRKRIPGSQPQRSSTLKSSSACSTRTTLTSRRQLLLQSILHYQWLSQQSSLLSPSSRNKDDRQDALRSALRRARCAKQGDKEEVTKRNPSQCSSKRQKPAGSRRSVSLAWGALPRSLYSS